MNRDIDHKTRVTYLKLSVLLHQLFLKSCILLRIPKINRNMPLFGSKKKKEKKKKSHCDRPDAVSSFKPLEFFFFFLSCINTKSLNWLGSYDMLPECAS